MPKFSVIIPVYNVEEYLRECVDSVINQKDFSDFEIILIDDGSPDKCGEICDEYSSKYSFIKTIHQKNSGLSAARNTGITNATGDYLLLLDSDDYIDDEALFKLNKLIHEHDCDLVVFNRYNFWKDIKYTELARNTGYNIYDSGDECLKKVICDREVLIAFCSRVIKRDIFVDNKLNFMESCLYEDFPISVMTYLLAKKICYFFEPLYFYRQRPDSIIHKIRENDTDIVRSVEYLEQLLYKKNMSDVCENSWFTQLVFGWVTSSSLTRYSQMTYFSKKAYRILNQIMNSSIIRKYLKKTYKETVMPLNYRISALLTYYCLPLSMFFTSIFFRFKSLKKKNNMQIK